MDHEPTPVDPGEVIDEPPPPNFEAQPDLRPDQEPGIVEHEGDLIDDAETEDPDQQSVADGKADEDDDVGEGEDDDKEEDT